MTQIPSWCSSRCTGYTSKGEDASVEMRYSLIQRPWQLPLATYTSASACTTLSGRGSTRGRGVPCRCSAIICVLISGNGTEVAASNAARRATPLAQEAAASNPVAAGAEGVPGQVRRASSGAVSSVDSGPTPVCQHPPSPCAPTQAPSWQWGAPGPSSGPRPNACAGVATTVFQRMPTSQSAGVRRGHKKWSVLPPADARPACPCKCLRERALISVVLLSSGTGASSGRSLQHQHQQQGVPVLVQALGGTWRGASSMGGVMSASVSIGHGSQQQCCQHGMTEGGSLWLGGCRAAWSWPACSAAGL